MDQLLGTSGAFFTQASISHLFLISVYRLYLFPVLSSHPPINTVSSIRLERASRKSVEKKYDSDDSA